MARSKRNQRKGPRSTTSTRAADKRYNDEGLQKKEDGTFDFPEILPEWTERQKRTKFFSFSSESPDRSEESLLELVDEHQEIDVVTLPASIFNLSEATPSSSISYGSEDSGENPVDLETKETKPQKILKTKPKKVEKAKSKKAAVPDVKPNSKEVPQKRRRRRNRRGRRGKGNKKPGPPKKKDQKSDNQQVKVEALPDAVILQPQYSPDLPLIEQDWTLDPTIMEQLDLMAASMGFQWQHKATWNSTRHPVARGVRALLYNFSLKFLATCTPYNFMYLAGGNPKRFARVQANKGHSLAIPVLDGHVSYPVTRKNALQAGHDRGKIAAYLEAGYTPCPHYLHDCDCIPWTDHRATIFTVDVLYYVTPQELGEGMLRLNTKTSYHMLTVYDQESYSEQEVTYFPGETPWGEGEVSAYTPGNAAPYRNSRMLFLSGRTPISSLSLIIDERRYSLSWEECARVGHMTLFSFTINEVADIDPIPDFDEATELKYEEIIEAVANRLASTNVAVSDTTIGRHLREMCLDEEIIYQHHLCARTAKLRNELIEDALDAVPAFGWKDTLRMTMMGIDSYSYARLSAPQRSESFTMLLRNFLYQSGARRLSRIKWTPYIKKAFALLCLMVGYRFSPYLLMLINALLVKMMKLMKAFILTPWRQSNHTSTTQRLISDTVQAIRTPKAVRDQRISSVVAHLEPSLLQIRSNGTVATMDSTFLTTSAEALTRMGSSAVTEPLSSPQTISPTPTLQSIRELSIQPRNQYWDDFVNSTIPLENTENTSFLITSHLNTLSMIGTIGGIVMDPIISHLIAVVNSLRPGTNTKLPDYNPKTILVDFSLKLNHALSKVILGTSHNDLTNSMQQLLRLVTVSANLCLPVGIVITEVLYFIRVVKLLNRYRNLYTDNEEGSSVAIVLKGCVHLLLIYLEWMLASQGMLFCWKLICLPHFTAFPYICKEYLREISQ